MSRMILGLDKLRYSHHPAHWTLSLYEGDMLTLPAERELAVPVTRNILLLCFVTSVKGRMLRAVE